jgi:hypothetical protein
MPLQLEPLTSERLAAEVEALTTQFEGVYSRETIERIVEESLGRFSEAHIQQYLPLLIHRFARERLTALGQVSQKH